MGVSLRAWAVFATLLFTGCGSDGSAGADGSAGGDGSALADGSAGPDGSAAPTPDCTAGDGVCSCSGGRSPLTPAPSCSPTSLGQGTASCCASKDWNGGVAGSCECDRYVCATLTNNGCDCTLRKDVSGATEVSSCSPPQGGHCCVAPTKEYCTCSQYTCPTDDIEVPDCTLARIDTTCARFATLTESVTACVK